MMRKYFIGIAFSVCTAASLSASAQTFDQVQSPGTICSAHLEPPPYEVWVFSDPNYGGTCAELFAGFYPNSGPGYSGFGLPNDSISSLKVGINVRARLFKNGVYSGASNLWWGGSDYPTMPSGWDNTVSSIRIENINRSTTCNDLQSGEYALFTDANRAGDCVVLHYANNYPEPINLGIANDSVSSVDSGPLAPCPNNPGEREYLVLYWNGYAEGYGAQYSVASGVPANDQSKIYLSGFNDGTSSTGSYCAF